MGLPVVILNVGLLVALIIWFSFKKDYSHVNPWLYLSGVFIQLTHFLEEYYTRFYERLPLLFDARPWTACQFLTFNIIWIIIFCISVIGVFKKIHLSFLIMWFFVSDETIIFPDFTRQ
ncbi:hypothetical protein [Negadavirga shengliensis]|uniref:Uncharacterized protein n=1 Tax=Negadavirga shengliensis TaxID=1389218 RepID=A0ABV9T1W5_9BACT